MTYKESTIKTYKIHSRTSYTSNELESTEQLPQLDKIIRWNEKEGEPTVPDYAEFEFTSQRQVTLKQHLK